MTAPLDLPALMARIAAERPIFHSEADFQHALCWQIHTENAEARIRLESRPLPAERMYLDCFLIVDSVRVALELKYLTKGLNTNVAGESFRLADHAADDVGRFLFLKDVARLERIVAGGVADLGYAILLTNEPRYWRPPRGTTRDAAFRLHEGRSLTGALDWPSDEAYPLASTGFAGPITLTGVYTASWREYSRVDVANGEFRYLAATVS